MSNVSALILISSLCFGFVLLVGHAFYFRIRNIKMKAGSKQVAFIKFSFALSTAWIFLIHFLFTMQWQVILFISINLVMISYFVFHIFNLSQTGRRIKILLEILESGRLPKTQKYGPHEIVNNRLKRLIEMNQIKAKGDNFVIVSRTFLLIGLFMIHFKRLFFPRV